MEDEVGLRCAAAMFDISNSLPKMLAMRLRILVADTDRQSADHLVGNLRRLGQAPHVCYSESECLELLPLIRPEVVFLDIAMHAICGEIRKRMHPQPVELIGLTQ